MAGHSKWAQIKRQKAVTDKKRGALFTKLGMAVTIAAREGGGDPDTNFKLRLAIDKARSVNVPKENIERAIKRGIGEIGGDELHALTYEAFVSGGVGIVIHTLTDNKNRTAAEIKHLLGEHHASLGASGSVRWQFKERGVVRISNEHITESGIKRDDVELWAIDSGAEDVQSEEDGITIYINKDGVQAMKVSCDARGLTIDQAEIELVPDTTVLLTDVDRKILDNLCDALDECEDVTDFYHNAV